MGRDSRDRDVSRKDKRRSRSRSRSTERKKRREEKRRERHRTPEEKPSRKERRRFESPSKYEKNSSTNSSNSNNNSKHESSKKESAFDMPPPGTIDKDEEQKRLEAEMQKRRERIERWRADRKRKELEMGKKDRVFSSVTPAPTGKKWSLEDDEESDDDVIEVKPDIQAVIAKLKNRSYTPPKREIIIEPEPIEIIDEKIKENEEKKQDPETIVLDDEEDEDIDPLDAYMKTVQDEVRTLKNLDDKPKGNKGAITIVTGVIKKSDSIEGGTEKGKKKGELLEQNQDGLEYSSEEEMEDIKDTAANLAAKQKKELAKIDHSSVQYMTFRKEFYKEVPEIAQMTPEEVDQYRCDLEGIQVKGKGCPKPIKTWAQCGISKKEMDTLKKMQFEKPTPIQAQAIPAVMSGRDLIGIAKTGSGKTLAFILPMFRHILDQPPLEEGDGPIAIILTPTRELCMQIGKDIRKFSKSLQLHAVCVYGGTGISEQIAELKRGAEIIVCTPGRMIDMLAANSGRVTNLKRVTYIVLDEADRMFDMGFEPQVMRIIDNVRPDRQTVMFSATFPRQMEALARRILKKPIEIIVGGRSVVCKEVEQHVVVLEDDAKFFKLLELLGQYQEHGSIIVFVDKQENADILLKDLMKASYPCMCLHGGIDQFDRDSTILDFKSGKCKLLIATSVAARGLDVKQLILVVNYDCPNHYEDYVHRVGRTGRAGNKGHAWTFVNHEQGRYAGEIIRALELSNVEVPEDLRNLFEEYKTIQEASGKKVHTGGGFSGKGFKFDEQEAAIANEKKKLQKAALGLQDSDDDDDLETDIDQTIEHMFATKRIVKEVEAPIITTNVSSSAQSTISNVEKLELAKKLASRINMTKNLGTEPKATPQQATEAIMKGSHPLITAKTVAEQLAAKLNTKLNYQPKEDDDNPEQSEQVFRKYEEELEINDFPQQARWKVTSKEALAQISEYSEAGLTVRGTYVPTGKPIPEGERKLYLAIESCSELAVSKAKREITRLIKEELLKMQATSHHLINKARYKVL
uniref:Probable ATP-dependent RNA helicase DDX46 n=1 Tax=Culicoides sonorensis TaxID=179676 RepID=A0A336MNI9_CULSO